jgi:hypothetical protein
MHTRIHDVARIGLTHLLIQPTPAFHELNLVCLLGMGDSRLYILHYKI